MLTLEHRMILFWICRKIKSLICRNMPPVLRKAVLAGGWDVAAHGATADLDIAAFLLDATGHIKSGADVIFFNHMAGTGIQLEGDNLTGEGNGDDERIDIELDKIPESYHKIVFAY